jgi:GLPGLI family protein
MKKITLVASLATLGFAVMAFIAPKGISSGKAGADNTFEGVITYSISVDNPQMASMMQNATMMVYIKGDKSKVLQDMGMYKTMIFADRKTPDDPIVLKEMMGNKYQIKNDKTKKNDKDPVIKYTDETKQVAGYNCHKAEVTITDEQGQSYTSNVYYTEELPYFDDGSSKFKGLKGFPLEFSIKNRGMNFAMAATKVEKKSVPDDTFTIPTGYKLVTQQEMMEDVQKNASNGN